MGPSLAEKFVAYLTLISGLTISGVAIYYSVSGLTAIFSAAVVPIIIMGTALEISKLVATIWLKQNWNHSPLFVKSYLIIAVLMLMMITNIGIFGFLSRAHSDQNLASGNTQAQLAVFDEKIKISKENIEANRRTLKQMDDAVEQIMARSTSESSADKSNAVRRSQQKDRTRLLNEIAQEQSTIAKLNEESATLRAEVRKVAAEVGPIKYVADFIYGHADDTALERAVTWMIICIIVVFDPLAIVLLLASQYSFSYFSTLRDPQPVTLEVETKQQDTSLPITEQNDLDKPVEELNIEPEEITTPVDIVDAPVLEEVPEEIDDVEQPVVEEFDEELDTIIRTIKQQQHDEHQILSFAERHYVQNEEQAEASNGMWSKVNDIISRRQYDEIVKQRSENQ